MEEKKVIKINVDICGFVIGFVLGTIQSVYFALAYFK